MSMPGHWSRSGPTFRRTDGVEVTYSLPTGQLHSSLRWKVTIGAAVHNVSPGAFPTGQDILLYVDTRWPLPDWHRTGPDWDLSDLERLAFVQRVRDSLTQEELGGADLVLQAAKG